MTPVPVITGVVFPRADETANFDFYRASIPGVDADEFLGEFLSCCGGSVYASRIPSWGYDRVHEVKNGDRRLAIIRHGGNRGAPISVEADGFASREFVDVVRRIWPNHYVTNIHSALDFDDVRAWGGCSISIATSGRSGQSSIALRSGVSCRVGVPRSIRERHRRRCERSSTRKACKGICALRAAELVQG